MGIGKLVLIVIGFWYVYYSMYIIVYNRKQAVFSNTSYFKLYINIHIINNIIYSELLITIVLKSSQKF